MTMEHQEDPRPLLLVTGASGFLGWHICRAASASWNVIGVYCAHETSIEDVATQRLDLRAPGLHDTLTRLQPAAVIHAAAFSQPNVCERSPDASEAVNVTATRNLAEWCGQHDVPLVYTSTDLVFDGQHPPYREDDATCPVNVYGRHKAEAEQIILEQAPRSAICRLPLMFGDRGGEPASFIGPWIDTLRKQEPLSLFVDEFRTPVSGAAAARGLMLVLTAGVTGILHLGGSERISRHAFGLKLAEVFGLSPNSIRATRLAEVQMAAPRAPDVSLDSSKAFALGYSPGTIDEQLEAVRRSMMKQTA